MIVINKDTQDDYVPLSHVLSFTYLHFISGTIDLLRSIVPDIKCKYDLLRSLLIIT